MSKQKIAQFLLILFISATIGLGRDVYVATNGAGISTGGKRKPEKTILIKIDPGAAPENVSWPLGFGIPLREGQAKSIAELTIVDGNNRPVSAEFEARTSWDDGSVQWLWADFRGLIDEKYYLVIGGKKAKTTAGVGVHNGNGEITVSNGVFKITWDKKFAAPVLMQPVSGKGEEIFSVTNGDGIYLIDQKDNRATLGGSGAELVWNIETANNLRAVLRVEGFYVSPNGDKLARAVLRYHIYWNEPWIRVEHRFIVTRENDEVWYKEIGLTFPLAEKKSAEVSLGKKDGVFVGKIGRNDEAYIYQKKFPIYNRLKEYACPVGFSGKVAEDCQAAAGWGEVNNGETRLVMAMKDFAEQFPKEISARSGGLTMKLWSGRDGKMLDYKPATMARDWWKDWLPRVEFSSITQSFFTGQNFTEKSVMDGTFNPSCVGVSRTHEFFVGYFPGKTDGAQIAAWAKTAQLPPVAYADPRWVTRIDARVLPTLAYKGEGGEKHETAERYISGWLDKFILPLEIFPMTGWYDWGKFSEQRYEKLPDGRIYAQFYRLELFNNYGFAKHMLYAWIRSGDRKYLDSAQRMTRLMSNYRVIQWGGGKDKKIKGYCCYGGGHIPVYWMGSGLLSFFRTDDFTGAGCLEYYLRDTRFLRDDLQMRADVLARDYQPKWANDQGHLDRHIYVMVEFFRLTKNPVFKKFAAQLFDAYTDLNQPYAINAAYYPQKKAAYETPFYKLSRKIMWFTMYADWVGSDIAKKVAVKAFQDGGVGTVGKYPYYYAGGPETYKNYMGYVAARIYDWTKDEKMLEHIEWQIKWLEKTYAAFEALPADERGLDGTIKRIRGPGARAGSPGNYIFKDILIPDKTRGTNSAYLAFGNWNNMVPLFAVPAGLWALCGASYDYPDLKIGE